jgi:hypothetical protein
MDWLRAMNSRISTLSLYRDGHSSRGMPHIMQEPS